MRDSCLKEISSFLSPSVGGGWAALRILDRHKINLGVREIWRCTTCVYGVPTVTFTCVFFSDFHLTLEKRCSLFIKLRQNNKRNQYSEEGSLTINLNGKTAHCTRNGLQACCACKQPRPACQVWQRGEVRVGRRRNLETLLLSRSNQDQFKSASV